MRTRFRTVLPSIPLSLTIFIFGLLIVDHTTPGQVVLALLMALLIPQVSRRLEREFAMIKTLRPLPRLMLVVLYDIVRANIHAARLVLGPERKLHSGWVWVPLDFDNIHGITALASVITLTPGTVSAELSDDRKYLLVHALDISDPQAVIDEIKSRYEAPLKEIFP
jgi:multicomponent K+:H+ antiporter subunit E